MIHATSDDVFEIFEDEASLPGQTVRGTAWPGGPTASGSVACSRISAP